MLRSMPRFTEADKDTNRSLSKEQSCEAVGENRWGQQPTQWSTYFYLTYMSLITGVSYNEVLLYVF